MLDRLADPPLGVTLPLWYWAPVEHYPHGLAVHGVQLGDSPNRLSGPGAAGVYIDTLPRALLAAVACLVLFDAVLGQARERPFRPAESPRGSSPADCELTARHKEHPGLGMTWPEALKPVLRREMEVYAGFMEFTRSITSAGLLKRDREFAKILDNTLIYYIIGDNGASAEGTLNGTFNEMIKL